MSSVVLATRIDSAAIEAALIKGDLSELSSDQRLSYYHNVCQSVGLNPLTQPFAYIKLNGKLVLYAKKDATDQLRKIHNISIKVVAREKIDDVYVVTAQARFPDGREDESTGAVWVGKSQGDTLANLYMKAETKAKRRATLSICGLGFLDETEVETIPDAKPAAESTPELSQPSADDDYVISFGKYKGKRLEEVSKTELRDYCDYIVEKADKEGQEIKGQVKDFLVQAELFLSEES